MNTGWLLLFKEDIITLRASVQYALFEAYVRVVAKEGLLDHLDAAGAKYVLKTAFLQASFRRFYNMNEGQIAGQLKEITRGLVERQPSSSALSDGGVNADPSLLLEAWSEVSPVLQRKLSRRRQFRLTLTVCTLAIMLLVGGLAFSTEAPARKSDKEAAASNRNESNASGDLPPEGIVHEVKSLKVSEDQSRSYADFKLGVPQTLPDGYHFEEAMVTLDPQKAKSNNIILVYSNEKEYLLRISYFKLAPRSAMSTGFNSPASTEEVFLRGSKGLLTRSRDDFVRLDWLEGDTFISISGRELAGEQVVKMAESLK